MRIKERVVAAGTVMVIAVASALSLSACFGSNSGSPDASVDSGGGVDSGGSPDAFRMSDAATSPVNDAGGTDGSLEAGPTDAQADAAPVDAPSETASTDAAAEGGDAAVDVGSVPNDAGACSVVGTWSGTYSCTLMNGESVAWVFSANGTSVGTIGDAATVDQTWSLSGETLSMTDVSGSACSGSEVGTYTLAFTASCAQMTLTEIADPCTGRGSCVNGLVVTRH